MPGFGKIPQITITISCNITNDGMMFLMLTVRVDDLTVIVSLYCFFENAPCTRRCVSNRVTSWRIVCGSPVDESVAEKHVRRSSGPSDPMHGLARSATTRRTAECPSSRTPLLRFGPPGKILPL